MLESRREHYRVPVDDSSRHAVNVETPSGQTAIGQILDLSASGAGIRFGGAEVVDLLACVTSEILRGYGPLIPPRINPKRQQDRADDTRAPRMRLLGRS